MDNFRWVQAALVMLALPFMSFGRVDSLGVSGDDWEIVMTLGQADGRNFKAIVQPVINIAANSYRYPRVKPVEGWTLIDAVAPEHGGMHATLYKEDGDSERLVLSFRGTDFSGNESSMADLCADAMWLEQPGTGAIGLNCSRFTSETLDYYRQAVDYTEKVMSTYPDSPLLLTGHSLGAGLALLVTATLDISPSLPVVAFSAPGVAEVLDLRSLKLSPSAAKRVFIIADMWDEIMRTGWEDQVGTTCLYPTDRSSACTVCFDETGATSTWQTQHQPSRLQNSISNEDRKDRFQFQTDKNPGFTDACWDCFLSTHILKHVMDLVNLGAEPVCEFHTTRVFDFDPTVHFRLNEKIPPE